MATPEIWNPLAAEVEANLRAALTPEVIDQVIADVVDRVRRTDETRAHLDAIGMAAYPARGCHWLVPVDVLARVLAREISRVDHPDRAPATYTAWRDAPDVTHDAFLRWMAA